MVSRRSGLWVTTFFLLFLFLQGIFGKGLLEDTLDDGEEPSPTGSGPLSAGPLEITPQIAAEVVEIAENYSSMTDASWGERMKRPWLRTIIKNPPFLENDVHHDDRKDSSLNTTSVSGNQSQSGLGDTWNDRMKNILVSITGMIPPVEGIPIGKMISLFLKVCWPSSPKPDIWSLIKDQMEGLVDRKILEFELQERDNEFHALQKTMEMYIEAQMREKGALMSTMIHAANELFFKLTNSKNSVQFIPLVVTHSTQHLLILKERLLHGKEMYDEDNTPIWRKDLEYQISLYKDYMKDGYSKWVKWRKSKIILDLGVHKKFIYLPPFFTWQPYGIVYDELTEDKATYTYYPALGRNKKDYFRPECEATKKKMFSLWNGELLQIMLTTFYLDNFIPGNEDNPSVIPPSMSTASFGPISPHIGGGSDKSRIYKPGDDNTRGGEITKINVREWNIIDGLQMFYTTHIGSFIGNSKGGELHKIPLNNRRVSSIQVCHNDCNMIEMTIGFSNGDSTGRLGNRGRWNVRCVNTGGIDNYGLYNIRATGQGCAKGPFQIELFYKAYSVRPSQIDNRAKYFVDLAQEKFRYEPAIEKKKSQCRVNLLKRKKKKNRKF